ncbi:cupin domain-containing protein [Sphingobium sp. MK2]|uniref:cupin domain-containing protein n=1 Tax=Sphingobium sp. MK2 TaxID=3116540 RepID=UPI0032E36006
MKKVELDQVLPYAAPGHFGMTSLKLHGREESGATKFWLGLSHFLPGGGAEWGGAPVERIYYVLSGEIVVRGEEGELTLRQGDSVFIGEDENRELLNKANAPASILVFCSNPS